jgi:ABC-type sugar transport system ATPase subunit
MNGEQSMNVIETTGLDKRYGSTWALRECALAIPAGHVAALVGPNGAGKTTLLNLAVGLAAPTAGTITVLGGMRAGSPAALDGIAFVAQDTPLYKNLSAADLLHLTRNLNRRFDQLYAQTRLDELGIPLKRKAGKLSGGTPGAAKRRPICWSGSAERAIRYRRAGRCTRSAWRNSPWPTCASPAPRHSQARLAAGRR